MGGNERTARGDGDLPGTGLDPGDPVEILGVNGAIMFRLRSADGRWLMRPVAPKLPPGLTAPNTRVVVIDSGVCDDHPSLVGRVIEQIDLTGEGVRDVNGHGTAVAAILATTAPGTEIISIKALDANGQCTVGVLNHALWRAGELLSSFTGRRFVNVSAGRRSPACTGDCPLCAAARAIQEQQDVFVVCAAGNSPGVTYCPAKSAFAVTVGDEWAAMGDVAATPPDWEQIP